MNESRFQPLLLEIREVGQLVGKDRWAIYDLIKKESCPPSWFVFHAPVSKNWRRRDAGGQSGQEAE